MPQRLQENCFLSGKKLLEHLREVFFCTQMDIMLKKNQMKNQTKNQTKNQMKNQMRTNFFNILRINQKVLTMNCKLQSNYIKV